MRRAAVDPTDTMGTTSGTGTEPDQRSDADFERLAGPLRAELLAHCYRITGSASDAEDRVQETYLRAWKAFHSFDGRASVRTWMYKIATNACLSSLTAASRRVLPTGLGQPAGDPRAALNQRHDVDWLEPLPDQVLWSAAAEDPESRAVAREGIGLAFVSAVQQLPPKQRATLVLREVVGLTAAETAEVLETTPASVNSAMQRARATLGDATHELPVLTDEDRAVVQRFVDAFEAHDLQDLTEVLTADVVWQMPPFDRWYVGARDAIALSETQCPAKQAGDLRLLPTWCGGQPAVALYLRHEGAAGTAYLPFQLQVLDVHRGRVRAVTGFFDLLWFEKAGLPAQLSA